MEKVPIKIRYLNNIKCISAAFFLEELGEYVGIIIQNIKGIIHIYFQISEFIILMTFLK